MYDTLILNGTCLLPDASSPYGLKETVADIGICQGRIQAIGDLKNQLAHKTINAQHLHVLPGIIDTQVHFREPGFTHKEDLETGTKAAALGGVVGVFEMPNTVPSTTSKEHFLDKIKLAQHRTWTDHAFFIGASTENATQLPELENLAGCCGVKIFMGSSTGSLLVEDDSHIREVLQHGRRRVAVHSEDEFRLRERKKIALETHDVHNHPVWRDVESAVRSTTRIVALAAETKRPVHVLHVSTAEEMEFLKDKKHLVSVEVLPQHLTLFAPDCYDRWGTLAQQNPPIREKRHMEAIWKAVQAGVVDIIGSDHAPHTREEKNRPYPESPSGMPGVQTLVPIMLNHVNAGRISLAQFVKMTTLNPQRLYKMQNKGAISTGFDADFTIIDLKARRTIENKNVASRCGWTIYDGMQVQGWPMMTIVRGQLVMQDDQLVGAPIGKPILFA